MQQPFVSHFRLSPIITKSVEDVVATPKNASPLSNSSRLSSPSPTCYATKPRRTLRLATPSPTKSYHIPQTSANINENPLFDDGDDGRNLDQEPLPVHVVLESLVAELGTASGQTSTQNSKSLQNQHCNMKTFREY